MERNSRETVTGRERVREMLDDRAAAGIEMDDDEAMSLAVSEQHAARRDLKLLHEALVSAAAEDLQPVEIPSSFGPDD